MGMSSGKLGIAGATARSLAPSGARAVIPTGRSFTRAVVPALKSGASVEGLQF
jgi:hypothetical protein